MTTVDPHSNGNGNNGTPASAPAANPDTTDEERQIDLEHQRRLEAIEGRLRVTTKKQVRIACVALLLPLVWAGLQVWEHQRAQQVVSVQPIGVAVHLGQQEPGPKAKYLVLETTTGFYPLLEPVVIPKDTPLLLETRADGRRYVCTASRSTCAKTAKTSLQAP